MGPAVPVTVIVGPATVRSSSAEYDVSHWAAPALAAIDDEFALVDEHPVPVAALWRELFASLLHDKRALLVFPSWWSDRRVATVADAARGIGADVVVQRRAALVASGAHARAVVVEIAGPLVAITHAPGLAPAAIVPRNRDAAAVAVEVSRQVASMGGGSAVIDGADGVDGAAELAALLTDRLRTPGFRVGVVDDDRLLQAVEQPQDSQRQPPRADFDATAAQPRTIRGPTLVAGGAAAAVLVVAVVAASGATPSAPRATLLVEGRVVVEVPASWSARRITGGPGSARLQVTSPTDPHTAIHVTQSSVPRAETLRDTADTLRRAMADEPPGMFVDFNPDDRRADRPAVTYREIRPGHDIRWAVLLEPGLRISVGCQSARGAEDTVASVCARAIASVRSSG